MIPYKDRFRMKHYMPNKAHSWGLKVFCHCSSNGFLYDFLIAGDSPLEIKNGLGYIGADVVLKLSPGAQSIVIQLFHVFGAPLNAVKPRRHDLRKSNEMMIPTVCKSVEKKRKRCD
ncbi:hypothetical protein T09_3847 [Trichinella sp. T9]|nr:hypothetical protein T09_3847 [Trichinella sp. T9]